MRQLIRQVLRQYRFLLSHHCRTKCDFCLQVCCLSCLGLVHICLLIVSCCLEIGRRVSPSLNDETNLRLIISRAFLKFKFYFSLVVCDLAWRCGLLYGTEDCRLLTGRVTGILIAETELQQ